MSLAPPFCRTPPSARGKLWFALLLLGAVVACSAEPSSPFKSDHWAFKPAVRPPIPAIKNRAWPRNPIDNFVLAKLEAANLAPAPQTDRRTLLRRLSFDLTGLPPTPEDVARFVGDQSPDAYEKRVEWL